MAAEENISVFDFNISDEGMKTLDSLDRGADGAVTWNPVGVSY